MIVGVDFDTTIVGSDQLFHRVAVEQGLVPTATEPTKSAVRDQLRNTGQEDAWTELQGYVYGARNYGRCIRGKEFWSRPGGGYSYDRGLCIPGFGNVWYGRCW